MVTEAVIELVRQTLYDFLHTFVEHPYLCYTEHGLHALFFTKLYNAFPANHRYTSWNQHQLCVIQKEYPTASSLGKPRRQHWDIAIIKTPPQSIVSQSFAYDYLRLATIVEFGLNAEPTHFDDDVNRVCHPDANIEHAFLIHLYRLSLGRTPFSRRDWSPQSRRFLKKETLVTLTTTSPIEILYGMYDVTGTFTNGVWHIKNGMIEVL